MLCTDEVDAEWDDDVDLSDPVPGTSAPTLAELAAARFGDYDEPAQEPPAGRTTMAKRAAAVVAIVILGGAIVIGSNALLAPDTTEASPSAPAASEAENPSDESTPTTTGAAQAASETARPTVEIDGVSYHIGEDGDIAATGDWDCDGEKTAALLRPSSGSVFVFERWATEGEELTATALTQVDGATGLRAEPGVDGCDNLVVESTSGDMPLAVQPA
jgi:hypothetical protein